MTRSFWIKTCLVLLVSLFAIAIAIAIAIGAGLVYAAEKVVIQLPWHHQFQFAGYYMAKEQDYYRAAGIDVEIRDVTQGPNSIGQVISGRANFGIGRSGLLVSRSLGNPVVVLATIFQQDPTIFLSLESSGIREPSDFVGKKVMLMPNSQSLSLDVLLHQEGLLDKIERQKTSYDYHSLLNGETDVFNAYRSNEPYLLKTHGVQTNIINPEDYGINFYGDTLFTSESFLQKNPKLVEKFRIASLKGWDYALKHSDETIAVIRSKYHVEKTIQQLQFEAAAIKKIIQPDLVEIGSTDLARWAQITHHLMAIGQISPKFHLDRTFLYNPPQKIQWQDLRYWIIGVLAAFATLLTFLSFFARAIHRLRVTRKKLREEIEDRKQAEVSLRDSEQKFRQLADHTHDWEYWIKPDGKYLYLSPACEKITGYQPEEFMSRPELLFDIVAPEYIESVHQHYHDENSKEMPVFSMVFSIVTKKGEECWIEHNCSPIFDEQGDYIGRRGNNRDITERKQAEEILRRYEHIILATGDLMSFLDRDYIYREVNRAYLQNHQKSREDIVGFSVADLLGKDVFEQQVKEKLDRCLAGEEIHYQSWFEFSGQGRRFMDIGYYPYTATDGIVSGVVVNSHDITDIKSAELALSEASKIISRSPTVAFLWKNEKGWPVEFVSDNVIDTFGYSLQEFLEGKVSYGEIVHRDDIERVTEELVSHSENEDQKLFSHAPYRIVTKNGETRWISDTTYIRRDGQGEITHYEGVVHDITDLKQVEEERSQLLQAIDQSSENIVITDKSGIIQYANPAFEKISGYTCKEAIGQNPSILKSGQQDDLFYQEMWNALTGGKVWRGRLVNKRKDGTFFTEEATITAVVNVLGEVVNYIALKRDITHEVEMEEQLRQKYKMEAVGVMAGGMAHNFNNNLSIILGNVELSLLKLAENSEAAPLLNNAKIAVLRSRDLIQQILTYSRRGAYSKTSIQLPEIIDESLQLLQSTMPSTINVLQTVSMSSREVAIHGDVSQIQEIVVNLCNNAVHAMDEVGDLNISLDLVDLEQKDIPVHYQCLPGCYAKLGVQDSGSGMSTETIGKIFDLFFTTKEVGSGTGVGLSTVQGIVDQHGGLIEVKSILGEGTTFEIYFPIIERRQKERPPVIQERPKGTEKILFLDDDEMIANVWSEMLREYGYQVSTMTSSTEALKLFAANLDYFDLVITDQTMPDLSGKDLILELLKIRPDLLAILCTGYSSKINEDEAKDLGIKAFCMKPLDLPELMQTVRRVLDEGKV